MTWGTIMVGRLPLREDWSVETKSGELTLKGQESSPPVTPLQLERRREDMLGLTGRWLPVTFTDKDRLTGWYRVTAVKADFTKTFDVLTLTWSIDLDRTGTENEVDVESRLSGPLTRNTSHAATGDRWHSPPVGHYGYWSGSTIPTVVTRTGEDGAQLVYRGVPATNPRWGVAPASALAGRCRFVDGDALERTGVNFTPAATGWELSNGLVRVRPLTSSGVLEVSAYTGGAWRAKSWDVLLNAVSLGPVHSVSLIHNELELVIVRALWATASAPGRTTADLILRRGARFLELYARTSTSSAFKVVRATTEAGTAGTGYVRATTNDGDGNRYVVGSAQAFTNDTVTGGLSKTATTTLDAFIGVAVAGSAAVSGDQPDHLMQQYLGSPNELVVPVRR
jgi:hypothetical protein